MKDFSLALKDFDEAIKSAPSLASAYRWRAQTFLELGNEEKAQPDLVMARNLVDNGTDDNAPDLDLVDDDGPAAAD